MESVWSRMSVKNWLSIRILRFIEMLYNLNKRWQSTHSLQVVTDSWVVWASKVVTWAWELTGPAVNLYATCTVLQPVQFLEQTLIFEKERQTICMNSLLCKRVKRYYWMCPKNIFGKSHYCWEPYLEDSWINIFWPFDATDRNRIDKSSNHLNASLLHCEIHIIK